MSGRAIVVLYALALIAVVVSVDVLFFKHHFWPRLMVNVGIVLIFGPFIYASRVDSSPSNRHQLFG